MGSEILIDLDRCSGCESCLEVCPFSALEMRDGKPVVNDQCTLCGACAEVCPEEAITLPGKSSSERAGNRLSGGNGFCRTATGAIGGSGL